jgi:hypothetical protein
VSGEQLRPDSISTAILSDASILSVKPPANSTSAKKEAFGPGLVRNPSQTCLRPESLATRNRERGGAYVKPILWTAILVLLVYVAIKVVPVLVAEYEFQDSMQDIARNASATGGTVDKIRAAVLKEAEKDELPVQSDDVKVTGSNHNVRINVDYTVTVDLNVYQWTFNFHPAVSNDSLL